MSKKASHSRRRGAAVAELQERPHFEGRPDRANDPRTARPKLPRTALTISVIVVTEYSVLRRDVMLRTLDFESTKLPSYISGMLVQ